jgi:DNA-binding response OmpR family regulator
VPPLVLVVDDEPTLREIVVGYLKRAGFETLEAADGTRAKELLEEQMPSLVLLDLMLPGTDGLELCRWIRARSQVPVIMLTARGEESDRVIGLELGADDYVTKPFSPRELTARVRSVLRRADTQPAGEQRISAGPIELDLGSREVLRNGEPIRLTAKEFDLLWFLASQAGKVFSRDDLMRKIWGYSAALDTGTLTVHIRRLREKLEADPSKPKLLETVWGVGYRYAP